MLERLSFGELPAKHHIALRDASGVLRYEHCLTRAGFDGPYSIAYHVHRPQALRAVEGAQPLKFNAYKVPLMRNLVKRAIRGVEETTWTS